MLFRMRHIDRWSLMHNTQPESLSQHTVECAFLVHFLAQVGNIIYGKRYDPDRLCAFALYHDAAETLTGDLPTPIKYYNEEMRDTYRQIEGTAMTKLLQLLPDELQGCYAPYLRGDGLTEEESMLLKAADKLCAHIKCLVESNAGNGEFSAALISTRAALDAIEYPELEYFLKHCLPAFTMPLDRLGGLL